MLSTRTRQRIIQILAVLGLSFFTPLLLITLFGKDVIAVSARHFLVQEVNQRFEKAGGLTKTIKNSTLSIRDKLDFFDAHESQSLSQFKGFANYIDENAERIIAAFIDERETTGTEVGSTEFIAQESSSSKGLMGKVKKKITDLRTTDSNSTDTTTSSPTQAATFFLRASVGKDGILVKLKMASVQITERLKSAVMNQYDKTYSLLVREIRVFCLSNMIIFTMLLVLSRSPLLSRALFYLALCLAVFTLLGIYLYITKTNWVWTMLTRNYLGWGYMTLIGFSMAVLVFYHLREGDIPIDISSDESNSDLKPPTS